MVDLENLFNHIGFIVFCCFFFNFTSGPKILKFRLVRCKTWFYLFGLGNLRTLSGADWLILRIGSAIMEGICKTSVLLVLKTLNSSLLNWEALVNVTGGSMLTSLLIISSWISSMKHVLRETINVSNFRCLLWLRGFLFRFPY